jgi:hypothetical protein
MTAPLLVALALLAGEAQAPRNGEELVRQMHQRYSRTWYRTLTFVQTTRFPDGRVQTWYEAARIPGFLRIDIAPLDSGRAILFRNDSVYQFAGGIQRSAARYVHPLMVLAFDVYADQPLNTINKLKDLGFDLSRIQAGTWQGRKAWIVGTATPGDTTTPQFWVDQENLLFVRLFQRGPQGALDETLFNKYFEVGGGWIAPEVLFFSDGRPGIVEEYADVQTGMDLPPELFDPGRFARPGWVR